MKEKALTCTGAASHGWIAVHGTHCERARRNERQIVSAGAPFAGFALVQRLAQLEPAENESDQFTMRFDSAEASTAALGRLKCKHKTPGSIRPDRSNDEAASNEKATAQIESDRSSGALFVLLRSGRSPPPAHPKNAHVNKRTSRPRSRWKRTRHQEEIAGSFRAANCPFSETRTEKPHASPGACVSASDFTISRYAGPPLPTSSRYSAGGFPVCVCARVFLLSCSLLTHWIASLAASKTKSAFEYLTTSTLCRRESSADVRPARFVYTAGHCSFGHERTRMRPRTRAQ